MRKWFALLLAVVLTAMAVLPAAAQESPSIPEYLTNDAEGRFTTLLAAVEAAGLVETLSGEGPFTLLAPTNDAFEAAFDYLGITAEDLLADTELLTQVLTYHVIPGRYFFRQLTSGPTLDSALEGEAVTFSLEGGVFAAEGVQIVDVDNVASNGIVHVAEGVLLPPDLRAAAAANRANIRVAHLSPDAGNVDIYLNGEAALEDVAYETISDYLNVLAGEFEVAVVATGGDLADAAIGPVTITVAPGSWNTVAAIGSAEAGTLTAQVIVEDYSAIPEGNAQVTVFHALEGAPAVDVLAGGDAVVTNLGFPGTFEGNDGLFTLNVPAGAYDFDVVETGTTAPILIDLPETELEAGFSYFVAAIGTPDAPSFALAATDVAGTP